MGYQDEIRAGYHFVNIVPTETCRGVECGKRVEHAVRFVEPAGNKGAHIKGFCSNCGNRREFNLQQYGPRLIDDFPILRQFLKSTGKKKRSKAYESGGPEFFASFGWCCVYCEGSRAAREFRLTQIETLQNDLLKNSGYELPSELELAFDSSTSQIPPHHRALENIFDLVPDHLFPVWLQTLEGLDWDDRAKQKAERLWVVSAHRTCNSKRKMTLESSDFLLFLYSRFLFPILTLDDAGKIADLLDFSGVLQRLEAYKIDSHVDVIRPVRRAI